MSKSLHRRARSDVSPSRLSTILPPSLRNLKLAFLAHRPDHPRAPHSARASQSGHSTTTLHDMADGASDSDDPDADSLFSDFAPSLHAPAATHCTRCPTAHALVSELEALVDTLAAANRALRRRLSHARGAALRLARELHALHRQSSPHSSPTEHAGTTPQPAAHPPGDSFGSGLTALLDAFPPTSPVSADEFYSIATHSSDTLPSPVPGGSGSSVRSRTRRRPQRDAGPASPTLAATATYDGPPSAFLQPGRDTASVRSLPFARRTGAKPAQAAVSLHSSAHFRSIPHAHLPRPAQVSFDVLRAPSRIPRRSGGEPPIARTPEPVAAAAAAAATKTRIPMMSSIRSSAIRLRNTISRRRSVRPPDQTT